MRKFHSSEYLNALASGEICLVVGWSGDIKQAQKRAAEAKESARGAMSRSATPFRHGSADVFRQFRDPEGCTNVAEAHEFINYMLRPDVAAKNSNLVSYPTAIWQARSWSIPRS